MFNVHKSDDVLSHSQDVTLCHLVHKHPCLYDVNHPQYKNTLVRDNVWEDIALAVKSTGEICKNRWRNIRDNYRRNKRERKLPKGTAASVKTKKWILYEHLNFLENSMHERSSLSNTLENEGEGDNTDNTEVFEVDDSAASQDDAYVHTHDGVEAILEKSNDNEEESSASGLPVAYSELTTPSLRKQKKTKRVSIEEKIYELLEKRLCDRQLALPLLEKTMAVNETVEDDTDVFFRSMAMTAKQFQPALLAETKKRICGIVMDMQIQNNATISNQGNIS